MVQEEFTAFKAARDASERRSDWNLTPTTSPNKTTIALQMLLCAFFFTVNELKAQVMYCWKAEAEAVKQKKKKQAFGRCIAELD